MKRLMLTLLSAVAVSIAVIPAAQASAAVAVPARTVASGVETQGAGLASQTGWRHVTLSRQDCAALGRPGGCTGFESTLLSKVSTNAGATTEYWSGYMQACAVVYSTGGCATNNWWVTDNFNFTTDYSTGQAWNNGTPKCATNKYTTVTWCSYVNNGTYKMQEGFNFGNGGYARMNVPDTHYEPYSCQVSGPSWANVSGYGFDYASNEGTPCSG
jgi:hypothetical protein